MISIIIPCLNESKVIGDTLDSICRQMHSGDEILVIDGGSTDNTSEMVRSFPKVKWIDGVKRGRAWQFNYGASRARGAYLLLLHADTVLPEGALGLIRKTIRRPGVVGATFRIRFVPETFTLRILAAFANLNIGIFTFGDQGLLLRADTYRELGGFRSLPIMEDVDLNRRLRKMGKVEKCSATVSTSSRRFIGRGVGVQLAINSLLLLAFAVGVSPYVLKKFYSDRPADSR